MTYEDASRRAVAALAALGQAGQVPRDVAEVRAARLGNLVGDPQPVAQVIDTSVPGPAGPLAIRAYRPVADPAPLPGIVYLHGGGFVLGNLASHDVFCRALARATGHVVVAVDYRLAPEHPYPAAVEDADAATRAVAARAAELGIDPDALSIGGDSAGGNLAAVVSQRLRGSDVRLRHQLLIVPVVDFTRESASYAEEGEDWYLTRDYIGWIRAQYRPVPEELDASPALAPDLSGLPAATIITAGHDPLRDEAEQYGEALRAAGVDVEVRRYEGAFHLFWLADRIDPTGQREVVAQAARRLAEVGLVSPSAGV